MQSKDIPEEPVLRFLNAISPEWGNWCPRGISEKSVLHAMPDAAPEKVALSKMRALIRKGLVDGCGCGCRGDFRLTKKGFETIGEEPWGPEVELSLS